MNCIRCGCKEKIEIHHIIQKSDGGSDDAENRELRCSACHKFEHAKRNILVTLEKEKQSKQLKKVVFLEHRLEVLEKLNTPELIKERGRYQTWWIDISTHKYPRYEKIKRGTDPVFQRSFEL